MSTTRIKTDKPCRFCGGPTEIVHMKTCHIDDTEEECLTQGCRNFGCAEDALRALARSVAMAEEASEHDYNDRDDSSDFEGDE